jgi:hypothetical protein
MHRCYNCYRFTAIRVLPTSRLERIVSWIAGACYFCLRCKFRFYEIL